MLPKTCCCCCCRVPVERGARIIGLTLAVLSVIAGVSVVIKLARLGAERDSIIDELERSHIFDAEDAERIVDEAHSALITKLLSCIISLIFEVILVMGVIKANRCLVLTFLIYFGISLAFGTIVIIFSFFNPKLLIDETQVANMREQHDEQTVQLIINISICMMLLLLVFFFYLFLVVLSYYKELRERSDEGKFRQVL